MTAETIALLTNKEVIGVDQGKLGRQGDRVSEEGPIEVSANRWRMDRRPWASSPAAEPDDDDCRPEDTRAGRRGESARSVEAHRPRRSVESIQADNSRAGVVLLKV
jgi:hypothetical protein